MTLAAFAGQNTYDLNIMLPNGNENSLRADQNRILSDANVPLNTMQRRIHALAFA